MPNPCAAVPYPERTIKCGKSGCACAQNPKARHGPYRSLTHAVDGKMSVPR